MLRMQVAKMHGEILGTDADRFRSVRERVARHVFDTHAMLAAALKGWGPNPAIRILWMTRKLGEAGDSCPDEVCAAPFSDQVRLGSFRRCMQRVRQGETYG